MQHKTRQNTTKLHRGVMEMEEESGHVWYYAQYVQRERERRGTEESINATIKRLFPQSYSLNI